MTACAERERNAPMKKARPTCARGARRGGERCATPSLKAQCGAAREGRGPLAAAALGVRH